MPRTRSQGPVQARKMSPPASSNTVRSRSRQKRKGGKKANKASRPPSDDDSPQDQQDSGRSSPADDAGGEAPEPAEKDVLSTKTRQKEDLSRGTAPTVKTRSARLALGEHVTQTTTGPTEAATLGAKTRSNTRPAKNDGPSTRTKGTKGQRLTSVQRLKKDREADAKGPPPKLTKTERILEKSGDPIAPPPRQKNATALLPDKPVFAMLGRPRRSDHVSDSRSASRSHSRAASVVTSHAAGTEQEADADEEDKEDTGGEEEASDEEEDTHEDPSEVEGDGDAEDDEDEENEVEAEETGEDNADEEEENEAEAEETGEDNVADDEDVDMRLRSPSPELQGSSRTEGGVFRGRAAGLAPNMADMEIGNADIVDEELAPLMGRVHLFTSRDPAAKPHLTMAHRVTSNLEPVLTELGVNYSPVKNRNQRIYVDEDGLWAVRGRFNDAINNIHTLNWNVDPTHGLVLRLLTDEEPASLAHPLSSIATSSSKTHTAVASRLTKGDLIKELKIPIHLTDRCDADLHLAFQRWKGNQAATNVLSERLANGTWPGMRPTEQQVYECFISKSTWFLYYRPNFLNIAKYPNMVLWLDRDPDAPSSFDLWGFEKATYHFRDLTEYIQHAERKGKGKGKGEKQEIAESSAKKRKGKGKEKEKEKDDDGKVKTHKKAKTSKTKGKDRDML